MAKARKAGQTQSKLMTILFGQPFTGKSTLALQLAYFKRPDGKPFRVLYLDAESGSIDNYIPKLASEGVALDNIYIVYTQSLGEVRHYIDIVKNNEDFYELDEDGNETDEIVLDADGEPFRADAIVVDGATILHLTTQHGLLQFSKKRNRVKADKEGLLGDARTVKIDGSGLELKDYQTIAFDGQEFILDLMATGVHCIVTAREDDEKVTKEIDGKSERVITGKKIPAGFKGMDHNAHTVIRTYFDEDDIVCAKIIKDRTGVHRIGEIIEDPSMLDYQVIIDRTKSYDKFVLKNDLTKAIEIESGIYEKKLLKGDKPKVSTDSNPKEDSVEEVRNKIKEIISTLSTTQKQDMKNKLKENDLPVNFTKITNVKVLHRILETIAN